MCAELQCLGSNEFQCQKNNMSAPRVWERKILTDIKSGLEECLTLWAQIHTQQIICSYKILYIGHLTFDWPWTWCKATTHCMMKTVESMLMPFRFKRLGQKRPCMSFCLIFMSYDIVTQYHTSAVFVPNSTSANLILILYNRGRITECFLS